MIDSILRWWVRRYYTDDFMIHNYKDDYVAKVDLKEAFEQVRKDAEDRRDEYWKKEVLSREEKLKTEYQISLMVEHEKTKGFQSETEMLRLRNKVIEELYTASITGAQTNQYISTEMRIRLEEAKDVFADLFGSVSGIEKNAKDQVEKLEKARKEAIQKENRLELGS